MTEDVRDDEAEVLAEFGERYAVERQEVNRAVERIVIGGDWGANGYTTMSQADELGALVGLGPGRTVLDVGSGRGWPGVYLAQTTGCDVILMDLPIAGLVQARQRAHEEGLGARVRALVASAAQLPLRPASVDAVVQTDVLC